MKSFMMLLFIPTATGDRICAFLFISVLLLTFSFILNHAIFSFFPPPRVTIHIHYRISIHSRRFIDTNAPSIINQVVRCPAASVVVTSIKCQIVFTFFFFSSFLPAINYEHVNRVSITHIECFASATREECKIPLAGR